MATPLSTSVVICTMNRPDALQKCLRSLDAQMLPPNEVILVHAGADQQLGERLAQEWAGARFQLRYVRSRPSLVLQRNLGIQQARGDVVFFLDDDVVLEPDYLKQVMAAYTADARGEIGGVQGSITNPPENPWGSRLLRGLFLLVREGRRGHLQRSGFPCLSSAVSHPTQVEVFSGCMMSFRRRWLEKHQFDEALQEYWSGDDWDLSYRISREARLLQLPGARLRHEQGKVSRDSLQRVWQMTVVNHRYLYVKHLRATGQGWLPWIWAEVGILLLALARMLSGRGAAALRGVLKAYREMGLRG